MPHDPTLRTARSIIEARLGRDLGPIAAMPRDIRKALYLLALHMNKTIKAGRPA